MTTKVQSLVGSILVGSVLESKMDSRTPQKSRLPGVVFLHNGREWDLADPDRLNVVPTLPGGNFLVQHRPPPVPSLYLEQIDDFPIPDTLYGDVIEVGSRIIGTFDQRQGATGVLLSGTKGSGKSLTAKYICATLARRGVPTIVLNKTVDGDGYSRMLQAIQQPAVVLMDEFEKLNAMGEDEDGNKSFQSQRALANVLTLLDGIFPTKKLFLLTCNDRWAVDSHMHNRPGRLFYSLEFNGVDENFIREYCGAWLRDPVHIEQVVRIASVFEEFNFDMLQALVEECVRYLESPMKAVRMLNIKPEKNTATYIYQVFVGGKETDNYWNGKYHNGSPLAMEEVDVHFSVPKGMARPKCLRGRGDDVHVYHRFGPQHFVKVDGTTGKIHFKEDEIEAVFERKGGGKEFSFEQITAR